MPPQWLAEPTPTERTEARAAPSRVVPDTTVAGLAHADRANRDHSNDLTFRAGLHIRRRSPRRPSEHRPQQRPHLSCPPRYWLAESMPTERTVARAAFSPGVPATTVAGWAYADQANRGQSSALTFRARYQWLAGTMLTKRTEARPAPSRVVLATTVAEPTPTMGTEAREDQTNALAYRTVSTVNESTPNNGREARPGQSRSLSARHHCD
jgi:hypothetical protein